MEIMEIQHLTYTELVEIFAKNNYNSLDLFTLESNININFIVNEDSYESTIIMTDDEASDNLHKITYYTGYHIVNALIEHYIKNPNKLLNLFILTEHFNKYSIIS